MKKIQLSDHFTSSGILLFSLSAIGMQLVDNTYQVAGGFFISSYIGPFAFAAENLVFPVLVVLAGIQCVQGGLRLMAALRPIMSLLLPRWLGSERHLDRDAAGGSRQSPCCARYFSPLP